MNSSSDDEIEMVIIPSNPDPVTYEEEINESDTKTKQPVSNVPRTWYSRYHRRIVIFVNDSDELHLRIEKSQGMKCESNFELSRETVCHQEHENIVSMISMNIPVELFHMIADNMIVHTVRGRETLKDIKEGINRRIARKHQKQFV